MKVLELIDTNFVYSQINYRFAYYEGMYFMSGQVTVCAVLAIVHSGGVNSWY